MQSKIYKIETRANWNAAVESNKYTGSQLDKTDGFIHFSTIEQVEKTLELYFANISDLVIVEVETSKLGEKLLWEPSRGGQLFPHLYDNLNIDNVTKVFSVEYVNGIAKLPTALKV